MDNLFEQFDFSAPTDFSLRQICGITPPDDYIAFMQERGGGEGFVGNSYVVLFEPEELNEINDQYDIARCFKDCFVFGSDGGGMLLAYNSRLGLYYQLDSCNINDDDSNRFFASPTLHGFFEALYSAAV